jgi:hypothetical protein
MGTTGGHPVYPSVRKDFYRSVVSKDTGVRGNGGTQRYSGALEAPVVPGTVRFTDGRQHVGDGETPGDGTLSIDYSTGAYVLTFATPVDNYFPVLVDYLTEAPERARVWIAGDHSKKELMDVGFGSYRENDLNIVAWFDPRLQVRVGDWFELPQEFSIGKVYASQFEVTSRYYAGLDREGLVSYQIAPRRAERPVEEERPKETIPDPQIVNPFETSFIPPVYPIGDGKDRR